MADDNSGVIEDAPYEEYTLTGNPEWADITPIEQDDGPDPIVRINYSNRFVEVMNYFRAILKKDERSMRALHLTAEVIYANYANYTAWHFRRLCLQALDVNLINELEFCEEIAEMSPKNYQLWFHRRKIVEWMKDPARERAHTAKYLTLDHKNYHVWSHRVWVCQHFNLWDEELAYTARLLEEDLRNNSAWNHRYNTVEATTGFTTEAIGSESRFTFELLRKAPDNESAWNYLRGLLRSKDFSAIQAFLEFTEETIARCPEEFQAFSFLVDVLTTQNTPDSLKRASETCTRLASELDKIRKKYWEFVQHSLDEKRNSNSLVESQ